MNERPSRLISFLFAAAIVWLIAGTALALLAALQLVWPIALPAWLSFGRVAPAAANILVYGWASSAALGVALWLVARDSPAPMLPRVAAGFLQIGVLVGVVSVLAGEGTSIFLLDFPLHAAVCIFLASVFLTTWGVLQFNARAVVPLYASSWYLFTALLAFPWLYASAYALLVWHPVPGSAQGPIAAWFSGGIVSLWLAPIALACLYFLVPSILRQRLTSYNLARPAFWFFIAAGAWSGLGQLLGGPIPAWLSATGAFAGQLLLIPVLFITLSFVSSISSTSSALRASLPLRFALLAIASFLGTYLVGAILSVPGLSGVFRFSDLLLAQAILILAGFVSPALFGLIAHIKGARPVLAWHFWLLVASVGLMVVCFALGGVIQSFAQSDPGLEFAASIPYVRPFRLIAAIGVLGFLISTLFFAVWYFRRSEP